MAIVKIVRGTGITAESRLYYTGDDLEPAIRAQARAWNAARAAGGGDYGAVALAVVRISRAILAEAGAGPHEADSPADFAERILAADALARAAIEAGNADGAARHALRVGALIERARMKFEWEADALRGEKVAHAAREGARIVNAEKSAAAAERRARIETTRADICEERPGRPTAEIDRATQVRLARDGVKVSLSTIRRARKK